MRVERKAEEKIEFYCGLFNRLYQTVSGSANPEHAVEIALGIFEEIAKDLRSEQFAQWRIKERALEVMRRDKEPATEKQREAIHKFGVKQIPDDLSKEEASEALDLLISFSKAGDRESIARIVNELNRRWTEKKKESQQSRK
jgi:hypothetical protein